uniref:Uncharacterized protein n=1 Tax=Myotis myotis TaxID=51298 RepID=A0A7J7UPX6_MYOMY|nr:hypothetical protein mMyoMyo1_008621 [Myotis myotis]
MRGVINYISTRGLVHEFMYRWGLLGWPAGIGPQLTLPDSQPCSPTWHPALAWHCPLTCSIILPVGQSIRQRARPPQHLGAGRWPHPPLSLLVTVCGVIRPLLTLTLAWHRQLPCFTIPPWWHCHWGPSGPAAPPLLPTASAASPTPAMFHAAPWWSAHIIGSGQTPGQTPS